MIRRSLLLAGLALPAFALPVLARADAAGLPAMVVHRTATCGCCASWSEIMRDAGFDVTVRDVSPEALNALKVAQGMPPALQACHTALIGGYAIEGHVPADDIRLLLALRPEAVGLAVPGMPLGSPGMDFGDRRDPYDTLLVAPDGGATVFARHAGNRPG